MSFVLQNSIRHNLSLHNRFMRVQNEGTGKSSWWMINPDAKPGKSARRRATSMETSKFEKRRGRVKKKVEAMRNGLQATTDATPSPSSSISEGLDMFPGSPAVATASFQLSPDFRPRASSNASSCGRMSPFHSLPVDTEWATYPTASGGVSFPFWPFAFHVRFQVLTAVKVAMLFPCVVMPCSRRLILTFRRNRDWRLSPSSPLEKDKSVPPPETFVFTYESTRLHSAEQHCLLPLLFEIR